MHCVVARIDVLYNYMTVCKLLKKAQRVHVNAVFTEYSAIAEAVIYNEPN
jgi:hypothetical protein